MREFSQLEQNDLNVIVFNFIDMLSHARTESKMIRELASSNAAYRSITESWFRHSSALEIFRRIAEKGYRIVLTTDHGTIRVENPIKVQGDKNTNTNLRYKLGKNLAYNPKQVFEVKKPADFGLPSPNVSTTYVFKRCPQRLMNFSALWATTPFSLSTVIWAPERPLLSMSYAVRSV